MKKLISNNTLFGIIIGGIIFGSIGVGATVLYQANQVSYTSEDTNWKVDNVKGALDELYKNSSFDIKKYSLSNNLINNGVGWQCYTTFTLTSIPNYENLVLGENFFPVLTYISSNNTLSVSSLSYSYSNGILTVRSAAYVFHPNNGAHTIDIYVIEK